MPPFNIWDQPSGGDTWESSTGMYRSAQNQVLKKIYKRLYAPEEFERLPAGIKSIYGNYMGYVRAYQKNRGAPVEGATPIQGYQGTAPVSSRIPSVKTAGAGAGRIPTMVHRGLGDTTNIELAGTHRGMGGELIPETPEDISNATALAKQLLGARGAAQRFQAYAIPEQQEISAEQAHKLALAPIERQTKELATKAAAYGAKGELEVARFKDTMTPAEKFELTKESQAAQKLAMQQQNLDDKNKRFLTAKTDKEYFMRLANELASSRLKLTADLSLRNANEQREWQEGIAKIKGEIPGTPEAIQKQLDIVARLKMMAENAERIAVNASARAQAAKAQDDLRDHQYWLEQEAVKESVWQNKAELEAQQTQYGKPTEIVRNVNGRKAVFNSVTKKFIRWL